MKCANIILFLLYNYEYVRIIFICTIFYFQNLLKNEYNKICWQIKKIKINYTIIFLIYLQLYYKSHHIIFIKIYIFIIYGYNYIVFQSKKNKHKFLYSKLKYTIKYLSILLL